MGGHRFKLWELQDMDRDLHQLRQETGRMEEMSWIKLLSLQQHQFEPPQLDSIKDKELAKRQEREWPHQHIKIRKHINQ